MSTEAIEYDIIIVGGGPAGLACAISCTQRMPNKTVCLIEKGAQIGSHILSGAILQPDSLNSLLPDWQQWPDPIHTPVSAEQFRFLSARRAYDVPHWLLPKELTNTNNSIISLGVLCRRLAEHAQQAGVDIFTSTAAAAILFDDNNTAIGVRTGAMGVDAQGQPKAQHSPGFELHGQYLIIAEGARGYLSERLIEHYQLRSQRQPTYGLGIKELWQVDDKQHRPGLIQHTAGWPLEQRHYGGSFIYHLQQQKVAVGFVAALDYSNTHFNPYHALQQVKTHPAIAPMFAGGTRIGYGARVLNEGGYSSLPDSVFPGGVLIGCAAGLLNVAKIKGIHNAIESGMTAAAAIASANQAHDLSHYPDLLQRSNALQELQRSRNFRHYFRFGLGIGTVLAGLDLKLFRGKLPWTLRNRHPDRERLSPQPQPSPQQQPPYDQTLTFNKQDSLFLANIESDENQPNHLRIHDRARFRAISTLQHQQPETRYCPANVYEYPNPDDPTQLTINASNCLHCKACDIKDPSGQLHWHCPEGGSGPNYSEM